MKDRKKKINYFLGIKKKERKKVETGFGACGQRQSTWRQGVPSGLYLPNPSPRPTFSTPRNALLPFTNHTPLPLRATRVLSSSGKRVTPCFLSESHRRLCFLYFFFFKYIYIFSFLHYKIEVEKLCNVGFEFCRILPEPRFVFANNK